MTDVRARFWLNSAWKEMLFWQFLSHHGQLLLVRKIAFNISTNWLLETCREGGPRRRVRARCPKNRVDFAPIHTNPLSLTGRAGGSSKNSLAQTDQCCSSPVDNNFSLIEKQSFSMHQPPAAHPSVFSTRNARSSTRYRGAAGANCTFWSSTCVILRCWRWFCDLDFRAIAHQPQATLALWRELGFPENHARIDLHYVPDQQEPRRQRW